MPSRAALRSAGIGAAAVFLLFVLFSAVVASGALQALDLDGILALQVVSSDALVLLGSLLSAAGAVEIEFPLIALGVAWLWWRGRRRAALALALVFAVALVAAGGKHLIDQPGVPPDLHRGLVKNLPSAEIPTRGVYPSGHVARWTYLGGLALLALARARPSLARSALAALIALSIVLMALTRPYLGEHWPTDAVGGILVAAAALVLVAPFLRAPAPAAERPSPAQSQADTEPATAGRGGR
jgi:undecaprenyl-diphosphatase